MSPVLYGLIAIGIFFVFMIAGMSVGFSMLFSAAVTLIFLTSPKAAGQMVCSQFVTTFTSYTIIVGPMFGLMGFLASYTGIGGMLFETLRTWLGHRRGGLASAVQVGSAGFGAICGSIPATSATFTAVAYPEMRKLGYSIELGSLCIVAGGTLSVLIPPSNTFIIYGTATEVSISQLFMAGIVPGIILMLLNVLCIKFLCYRHPEWGPPSEKCSWKERWKSLRNGGLLEILIVFVIAMGGMFAGFFTPTEGGAVGVFGMFLVTLINKQLSFKKLWRALLDGVRLQCMMFVLMACSTVFGKVLTLSTIPVLLANFVADAQLPKVVVLIAVIVIYFIFGMITDIMGMVLATISVFYPLITNYCGYDPLWFGVLIILMASIGNMTPPVGNAIFMEKNFISNVDPDVPLSKLFNASWPWVAERLVFVVILILVPSIATWLPSLMFG